MTNYNTINAEQAVNYFIQGNYEKAAELFRGCEEEYLSDEQRYIRSILYFQEGEFESCFDDLNELIAFEPYCFNKKSWEMMKEINRSGCIPFESLFKGYRQIQSICDVMIRICDRKDILDSL